MLGHGMAFSLGTELFISVRMFCVSCDTIEGGDGEDAAHSSPSENRVSN